jgi:hypothetical protein
MACRKVASSIRASIGRKQMVINGRRVSRENRTSQHPGHAHQLSRFFFMTPPALVVNGSTLCKCNGDLTTSLDHANQWPQLEDHMQLNNNNTDTRTQSPCLILAVQ